LSLVSGLVLGLRVKSYGHGKYHGYYFVIGVGVKTRICVRVRSRDNVGRVVFVLALGSGCRPLTFRKISPRNDPLPEGVGRSHVEMLKARLLMAETITAVQDRLWDNLAHT
jgi:hypothetical protein